MPDALKPARLEMPALIAQGRTRLNALAAQGKLSGSFLLAQDGKVLMAWQGGLADREQGVPVDAATKFRLASLNKMFTAVAILQLAEAGRLSLDDTIARHLQDCPNQTAATSITIRQLLNHTSGFSTQAQKDKATSPNAKPESPCTKPATMAPSATTR